jgi:hypothetical protein
VEAGEDGHSKPFNAFFRRSFGRRPRSKTKTSPLIGSGDVFRIELPAPPSRAVLLTLEYLVNFNSNGNHEKVRRAMLLNISGVARSVLPLVMVDEISKRRARAIFLIVFHLIPNVAL